MVAPDVSGPSVPPVVPTVARKQRPIDNDTIAVLKDGPDLKPGELPIAKAVPSPSKPSSNLDAMLHEAFRQAEGNPEAQGKILHAIQAGGAVVKLQVLITANPHKNYDSEIQELSAPSKSVLKKLQDNLKAASAPQPSYPPQSAIDELLTGITSTLPEEAPPLQKPTEPKNKTEELKADIAKLPEKMIEPLKPVASGTDEATVHIKERTIQSGTDLTFSKKTPTEDGTGKQYEVTWTNSSGKEERLVVQSKPDEKLFRADLRKKLRAKDLLPPKPSWTERLLSWLRPKDPSMLSGGLRMGSEAANVFGKVVASGAKPQAKEVSVPLKVSETARKCVDDVQVGTEFYKTEFAKDTQKAYESCETARKENKGVILSDKGNLEVVNRMATNKEIQDVRQYLEQRFADGLSIVQALAKAAKFTDSTEVKAAKQTLKVCEAISLRLDSLKNSASGVKVDANKTESLLTNDIKQQINESALTPLRPQIDGLKAKIKGEEEKAAKMPDADAVFKGLTVEVDSKDTTRVKQALQQLEQLGRDYPTDMTVGHQVFLLAAKAKQFLFEKGELKTLSLTLDRYDPQTASRLSEMSEKNNPVTLTSKEVADQLLNHLPDVAVATLSAAPETVKHETSSENFKTLETLKEKQSKPEVYETELEIADGRIAGYANTTGIHDDSTLAKEQQCNDSIGVLLGKGWESSVICDGNGTSPAARLAADQAKVAFQKDMQEQASSIKSVKDVGRAVLKAMEKAHEAARKTGGSTTFTVNFMFELADGKKMAIVAGLGDSPAAVRSKDGTVTLLTPGIREYTKSDRDPGGGLGDNLKTSVGATESAVDIRNLFMTALYVEEGDTVFIGSDGAFDSLDPDLSLNPDLSLTPDIPTMPPAVAFRQLQRAGKADRLQKPADNETWLHAQVREKGDLAKHVARGATPAEAQKAYRNLQPIITRFHEMKLEQLWGKGDISPEDMHKKVWEFAHDLTKGSRAYSRANRGQEAALGTDAGDGLKVLGKIDDWSGIAHRIGKKVGVS